ncbi:hypothetical protein [Peribacillus asahii]|uniref:Uncharacterized protein n=1 Tax=Peribacillus asahii TaxID=228899 RepID=A0A3T0KRU2_9BACI|nr:hypothetical protein [Peribacillus asahii]AZV42941.1 hypothetical protein BAOM_2332 [Peribacillus asahii]USK87142.1 hypothetical protein LIT35_11195 [Peribacillus asahii]
MNWNWNETAINLPYTFDNLKELLNNICNKKNNFSQYEFAKWCDNLTVAFDDDEADDLSERDELAFCVARDIECQWDLYLINTYSDKKLRTLDLSQVSLPQEWFLRWFEELNNF